MVPHSWISDCLEIFDIANDVQDLLNSSMTSWKLELNASGKTLGEVDIRRGILQGNSLSSLFAFCMAPLTQLLRRSNAGYEQGNNGEMPETTYKKETQNWLRKADLKVETEAMLCSAQEQAIGANYLKHKIKQPNHHFVECVTGKVRQYLILQANVKSWHKRSAREGTLMLQEQLTGNCVENPT